NDLTDGSSIIIEDLNAGSSWIQLNATNPLCTSTYIDTLEVEVNPEIELSVNGNVLSVDDDSYDLVWFLDGNPIDGVTGGEFAPDQSGNYSVMATNQAGCSVVSNTLFFNVNSIEENDLFGVNIYPVPTSKWLNVELDINGEYCLEIRSVTGQLIVQKIINGNGTQIDLSSCAAGSYVLSVIGNEGTQNMRLLVK
ncbi:MAG: T9SS type A sorting domain-containing protein, partial [Flavobacteriales bacterium]|nr:T9SS type A sorting domain-containing protein [Flavobacteriales bacterium]